MLSSATNGYNDGVWPGIYYSIGCGGGLILAGLLTARKAAPEEGYGPLYFFAKEIRGQQRHPLLGMDQKCTEPSGNFYRPASGLRRYPSGFGIPFEAGVVITAVVILIYRTVGGMWGVVLTDVIQTGIIIVGIPILAVANP